MELRKKNEEKKAEESKKQEVAKSMDWTEEEITNLTKGIKKFPPGTVSRWKVVAEFVGSKNQREVIAKAKDLQL